MSTIQLPFPTKLAARYYAEHEALTVHVTKTERALCRKYIHLIQDELPGYIMAFARELLFTHHLRWQAYEIIAAHKDAFHDLDGAKLEELGQGINSWWTVDSFARTLSGPAWRDGMIPDAIHDEGTVTHLTFPVEADVSLGGRFYLAESTGPDRVFDRDLERQGSVRAEWDRPQAGGYNRAGGYRRSS